MARAWQPCKDSSRRAREAGWEPGCGWSVSSGAPGRDHHIKRGRRGGSRAPSSSYQQGLCRMRGSDHHRR